MIDHRQLSDPAIRRKVVAALDLPTGGGEQDASLYLLFKAIREQSTVALSGEASDEIFGGYRQFHDPGVQRTDAFPWIAIGASWTDPSGYILTPELRAALDLETYLQDRYVDAVAEVERLADEDDFTHRMRVSCSSARRSTTLNSVSLPLESSAPAWAWTSAQYWGSEVLG